ncbi:GTPase domain-containing protein [Gordonia aquimaris]|uniref:GTPase domain-containing protein n=1 Tax=Gordonia aquimaris TaxID=2984863 RepID=A0A9X3I3I9_9ACTN|nr:GTPase domain-containing protein [Gordonia aquimaris]MCX2963702.1 GTPase domain-containing protein [Gordonia aquimaris]
MAGGVMAGAGVAADVSAAVAGLTGYEPAAIVGGGTDVAVFGIGGTGVSTLLEACRHIDPTLRVESGRWGARADDAAVGAALLVVDPTSSVGAEERGAVDELRRRFGTVALVCTKIDAYWEWPRILRAHRATLDPREELPVFAVSSTLALSGTDAESGVGALLQWAAEEMAAAPAQRRERARTGAALAALGQLEDELLAAEASRDDDPENLAAHRRRVLESRDRGRADRLAVVRAGLTRVRSETIADIAGGTRALAADATARTAGLSARGRDEFARWLTDQTTAMRARVDTATDERLDEVSAAALLGIDAAAPRPAPVAGTDDVGPPFDRPVPTARRSGEDLLVVLIGASSGLGLGRLIVAPMASVHTLQWVSMPLTLVLGVLVAVLVIRVRRSAAVRAEMRTWSGEALNETRARLEHRVGSRVAAAEAHLIGQITRYHERRTRQAAADIAAIDEQLRALRTGAARQPTRDRLARVRALRAELARV